MTTSETVRLGLMPPLSGIVGIYGEEITRAGRIACQEINENGGVLGRQLELIIEDDGSLPESAVCAAKKLLDLHGCVALIGNLMTNSRIAVAYRIAEPRRIPYLCFSLYEGSVLSRYYFHFAALPNQQIDLMIPYMKDRYGPKMFFCGNNYEWPRGSVDAAKRVLAKVNGQVVGEEYYPLGLDPGDARSLMDHVHKSAANVLVPFFAGSDELTVLAELAKSPMSGKIKVVMTHFDEVMASHLTPGERDGLYSSNSYFMTVDTPENWAYLRTLSALPEITAIWPHGNGILTNFGEATYLCVKAFAQAANEAGCLDEEALVDALETVSLAGPQGIVTMDRATHHAKINSYLSRCGADGTFTIVEHFGAIAPIIPERYCHQAQGLATNAENIRLQARIIDQMNDAVCLINASDDTIVYVNPGFERMFGYQKNEIIGKPPMILYAPSEGTSAEIAVETNKLLYLEGVWRGERRTLKKDGTPFWCLMSISSFTHARYGEVWLANLSDITERKQTENMLRDSERQLMESHEHFRQLAESIPNLAWMAKPDGWVYWFNSRWYEYTGTKPEQMEGWGWQIVHDPHMLPTVLERWREAIAKGLPFEMKFPLRGKDGTFRVFLTRVSPLRAENGDVELWVGTHTDIEEIQLTENELKKAKDAALSANESKNRFLATMSHDLRTPLNAIIGFSELLLMDSGVKTLGPREQESIRLIAGAGHHLLNLVQGLLVLSSIECGRITLKKEMIDLNSVLTDLSKSYKLLAGKRDIKFSCHFKVGKKIFVDPFRLREVINNLINNAIKFTPAGGLITLGAHEDASKVAIFVKDTGVGIEKRDLERIFLPFEQSEKSGTYAGGSGVGLGLSICRQLVELHGGKLTVESTKGEGSCFTFTLPYSEENQMVA